MKIGKLAAGILKIAKPGVGAIGKAALVTIVTAAAEAAIRAIDKPKTPRPDG